MSAMRKDSQESISDAMNLAVQFLLVANGQCPFDVENKLNEHRFHALVGFQLGVVEEAGYLVGLSPTTTVAVYKSVLETVNGMSRKNAQATTQKLGKLQDERYPPIEVGRQAFHDFYKAKSEDSKAEVAKRLWEILEPLTGRIPGT